MTSLFGESRVLLIFFSFTSGRMFRFELSDVI